MKDEWRRLRADFAAEESKYHDITISRSRVAVLRDGRQAEEPKCRHPHHAVMLCVHSDWSVGDQVAAGTDAGWASCAAVSGDV